MTDKNIAVIGAGCWGRNLVRNFHELKVLNTVCDSSLAIRKQVKEAYPDIEVTPDIDYILKKPEIRAVVIAIPSALHYGLAERVLLANKDVFVEKPMALTYADGENLVRLAAEKNRCLFVGHILQYHAAVIKLKEMIHDGKIGRLQYVYSRRLSLGKIRREENSLWSFAPHDISVILSLTGEEPNYIDAVGSNFLHAQIADVTMTNLKFPSGIGAHIFVSWLNPFKEQKLVIVGSNGMLVFDDTEPLESKLVMYPHIIDWQNNVPVPKKAEAVAVDITEQWEEPLKSECSVFLHAIKYGSKPTTSGEEGLRVLKVLELSQKSIEQKENLNSLSSAVKYAANIPDYFVHSTAIIDDHVTIGKGSKIWHFSHILARSKIGKNCSIGQNVVIGPDVSIGKGCKIQNNVSVYKGVTLEEGVFCGPSMVFTNIYNPRADISKMDQVRPTIVKKGVTIGANATIVCGHTIGEYAFIGAGTVLTKDVPAHALMIGNPAKQIGWVCTCGEKLDEANKCKLCGRVITRSLSSNQ